MSDGRRCSFRITSLLLPNGRKISRPRQRSGPVIEPFAGLGHLVRLPGGQQTLGRPALDRVLHRMRNRSAKRRCSSGPTNRHVGHFSGCRTNRRVWDRPDLTIVLILCRGGGFVSEKKPPHVAGFVPAHASPADSRPPAPGSRGRTSIASSCRPIGAICSSEVARRRHGRNWSRLGRCREPRSGTDRRPEQRDRYFGVYA